VSNRIGEPGIQCLVLALEGFEVGLGRHGPSLADICMGQNSIRD
jgi:hypothetical protein